MIMRKVGFTILAVIGVLFMGSCQDKNSAKEESLQREIDSLVFENTHIKADYEEMIHLITNIQIALSEIKSVEKILVINANKGDDIDANAKNQIIEDITKITNTLKDNKEKIAKLNRQLIDSKNESVALKQAITSLNEMIEEKSRVITDLQNELSKRDIRIAELDHAVTTLTQMNTSQSEVISSQDSELNRIYYALGSSKELREQKIIEKRGKNLLKGDFNHNYFTSADLREITSIEIGSKKAEILTSHPNGSYSLDKDGNGYLVLNISKPQLFWSTSRYLVIEVE